MRIHHVVRVAALLFSALHLSAAGFNITIEARAGGKRQTSAGGQNASAFSVKRGESLTVQWTAINAAPSPALSDVTMHAVLSRDGMPGPTALYEGAVNLDFRAGDQGSGNFRMPMVEPGNYVLRVETIGIKKAGARAGGDAFATMKVTVQ